MLYTGVQACKMLLAYDMDFAHIVAYTEGFTGELA